MWKRIFCKCNKRTFSRSTDTCTRIHETPWICACIYLFLSTITMCSNVYMCACVCATSDTEDSRTYERARTKKQNGGRTSGLDSTRAQHRADEQGEAVCIWHCTPCPPSQDPSARWHRPASPVAELGNFNVCNDTRRCTCRTMILGYFTEVSVCKV